MEMFPLIVLTVNITRLTNEMRMVTSVVNKLINRCIDSEELLTEMKRFSMTLLTRNDQFTAYNFFAIDCTLLHSIISTTATYLIILFQFQDNSNEDDNTDRQNPTTKTDE
ncbi:putative gustatory receptor 2a [Microplitis demolitor]|uniref:putative gustatory receptor 2a n=1 Tax=Microplitis demolitor TaxID=69319 RepID=UPI0004CD6836|nr:putative gustatory receptor 2a [Microplitis demolitor]